MSTYKVLQDIEAEDKFLGPLTLKQFIYAAITAVSLYVSFLGLTKGTWLIAAILSPVILFGGFLAWPWSSDQPTEIWLLAKISFFLKPRRRIWDQSGIQELVTITAPKHIEKVLTNGLSQIEVKSRLQALANTIDSRGWAVKNVNVNLFSEPSYVLSQNDSDRLIDPSTLTQEVPGFDVSAVDDVLDEKNNPTAQHFSQMISASSQAHRQEAVARMQQAVVSQPVAAGTASNALVSPADYWFMNNAQAAQPGTAAFATSPVVTPGATDSSSPVSATSAEEQALLGKIHEQENEPNPASLHMRTLEPVSPNLRSKDKKHWVSSFPNQKSTKAQASSTPTPDPAILELANNDDLNVATIARQADKAHSEPPQDEVVISLR